MTTTLSVEEVRERVGRFLTEQADRYAQAPARSSRSPSPATRRKLSEASRRYAARRAVANGNLPAVKAARLDRGWTLAQASAHAGLASLNTVWNAENRPAHVSRRTWRALSRAYGVPVDHLRP